MLDARIAELGPAGGAPAGAASSAGGTASSAGGTTRSTGSTMPQTASAGASPQAAAGTDVTVNISIAPALKARLTGEAPLFVFAREPGGQGPPLAAKRLTSAA